MPLRASLPSRRPFTPATAQRDTPDTALASFQKIVDDETSRGEQGEFGFKALKQMTKLTFKLGRYDEALAHYKTLLTYTRKAVTRNVAEKAINRILDYVSADTGLGLDKMQEFYEVTMKALEEQKNEVRNSCLRSDDPSLTLYSSSRSASAPRPTSSSPSSGSTVTSTRA